jgi:hypothetical protein
MSRPSLPPEYNLHRASQERAKAEQSRDPVKRAAHLELASLFEMRAVEALDRHTIH